MWWLLAEYAGLDSAIQGDAQVLMALYAFAVAPACGAVVLFFCWRFLVGRKVASFLRGASGLLLMSLMMSLVAIGQYLLADVVSVLGMAASCWVRKTANEKSIREELSERESQLKAVSYVLTLIVAGGVPILIDLFLS